MTRIAFISRRGPHGSASGREGLDALLEAFALTESFGTLSGGDGVMQLVREQSPHAILQRHYAPLTFKDAGTVATSKRSMFVRCHWLSEDCVAAGFR